MIKIVDYGSGNIQAISNIYKRLNIAHTIAASPGALDTATKLILPGVGAFDQTMQLLVDSGLEEKLDELVLERKVPILGICVGMQIMGQDSEEGHKKGLGWIDGKVIKIDISQLTHKPHLPHMGWNSIKPYSKHHLLEDIDEKKGFYFLHSYYFSCNKEENVLTTSEYGGIFASSIFADNIFGVQFHPEKSHQNGIQIFKNFANL